MSERYVQGLLFDGSTPDYQEPDHQRRLWLVPKVMPVTVGRVNWSIIRGKRAYKPEWDPIILGLLAGLDSKQIGDRVGLTARAVRHIRVRLFDSLGVSNVVEMKGVLENGAEVVDEVPIPLKIIGAPR